MLNCNTIESLVNLRQTLADRLVFYRKRKGWKQHDLAAHIGTSVEAVRGYEQQRRWPDPEMIEALATALEIRPIELLTLPEEMADVPITVDHALFVLRSYVDATRKIN